MHKLSTVLFKKTLAKRSVINYTITIAIVNIPKGGIGENLYVKANRKRGASEVMARWTTVNINDNQVERSTERAYLIKMPHNSDYDGFSFWYPIKLTHSGSHSASIALEIPDDFAFNLRRYSPRTRKLLDSVEIDAYTLAKQLETVSQNITAPLDKSDEPIIEVKEPKYRKPEETEVPDCLKTN